MPAPLAYIGRIVQTPANELLNGGVDRMAAVITDVGETGPNGGTMVSLKTFPNTVSTPVEYIASAEFVEYEGDAFTLGIGDGCWPTDSNE